MAWSPPPDKDRDAQILKLWLACKTQEEIAEATGYKDRSGPYHRFENSLKNERLLQIQPPSSLQLYNVWNFATRWVFPLLAQSATPHARVHPWSRKIEAATFLVPLASIRTKAGRPLKKRLRRKPQEALEKRDRHPRPYPRRSGALRG